MVKRQEIECLQTTLQGIIQHSTAKKIDIEDLKHKLAEGIRANRFKTEASVKENRSFNKSKSKSPGHFLNEDLPDKGSAVKNF